MLCIDLLPNSSLPTVKVLVTFSFAFNVKQEVTYMKGIHRFKTGENLSLNNENVECFFFNCPT